MYQLFSLSSCQLTINLHRSCASYLFCNDLRYASVAMSQSIDGNTRGKIEIPPVLNIPHVAAIALLKHGWRANISRYHVR